MHSERKDDIILAELAQKFTDFMERYERDWHHTQVWRKQHDLLIMENADFIKEFKPVYRKVMLAVWIIFTGTLSLALKALWDRISFK